MVVLDAGVVIAGLDTSDVHHAAAARVFTAARDRSDSFVLPVSAYAEVLVRPAAHGAATVIQLTPLAIGDARESRAPQREVGQVATPSSSATSTRMSSS